jgi:hypothetical protein
MCAKLGELFQLAKRKTLTANIFLEREAFSNLLLKNFFMGSAAGILSNIVATLRSSFTSSLNN